MKVLVLILVMAVVCVVLFIAGVFFPGRSRSMQRGVARLVGKGEDKGDENAGRVGDLTRDSLKKMRKAADASAEKGRAVNERVTGGRGN